MQQDVLPSTKKIVDSAKFAQINSYALEKFCQSFKEKDLKISKINLFSRHLSETDTVGLITLFNCINFSYWAERGKEKWAVEIGGKYHDGATGLFRALEKAVSNGVPLLEGKYLSNLTKGELGKILKGNVKIPMLAERTKCLNEAGKVLLRYFQGSFINVLKKAEKSAVKFTNLLLTYFPSFNDLTVIDGKKTEFHKRAQLNAKMISDALENKGLGRFIDLDKLTIFADYKIPQVLRKLGILKYHQILAKRIDKLVEIPAGSREEVEIRASTIWAVEEMKEKLRPKFPWVTSAHLDSYFWLVGQKKSPTDKPYHRTKTIYY